MNHKEHLEILECNEYSLIDEIKYQYKRLVKIYHPDLNPGIDRQLFVELTDSYNWLLQNHKPKLRPKDISNCERFYRVFNSKDSILSCSLPLKKVEVGTVIFCIWGMKEFTVFLEAGKQLPLKLILNNISSEPIEMNIVESKPEW